MYIPQTHHWIELRPGVEIEVAWLETRRHADEDSAIVTPTGRLRVAKSILESAEESGSSMGAV